MARMKLSPPWAIKYWEIEELFKYDPEVHVVYDEDNYEIKLFVDNPDKADALNQMLVGAYNYGNVTLKVTVVPADGKDFVGAAEDMDMEELFETAFLDNSAFRFVKTISGTGMLDGLTYVVFAKRVVQYYTDNLSDYFGNCSTLYQDIAKDVFVDMPKVFYSTDVEDPVFSAFDNVDIWP